jgi:hypothetical protein
MGAIPATSTPQSIVLLLEPLDRQRLDQEETQIIGLAQLPDEIVSPPMEAALNQALDQVDAWVKRERPSYDKVCADAYDAWQSALENRRRRFGRFEAFIDSARKLLGRWKTKQDEVRRQEQQRLEEEDRKRRIAARDAEAKQLEKQGQKDLAAAVKNTPVAPAPVTIPDVVPKRAGQSYRDEWRWRPVGGDTPEGRAAMEKILPREYMSANEVKLNGIARAMKGTLKVPGVEFYCEKVLVRR